ncbi:MAG: ABC transporter permease [Chloroflexi bacterium]|nr:ABC transporter permease [Chloroflexota bacterium]
MNETKEKAPQKNAAQIFFEEMRGGSVAIPILAIISGFILGGLIVAITSDEMYIAFQEGSTVLGLKIGFNEAVEAFKALFIGAFGNPSEIWAAFRGGDDIAIQAAIKPFLETLVQSTPFIFVGLSVALGFRTGLFNIGAEGQLVIGSVTAVWAGYAITGLPALIHIPLALLIGALGGALWGFIPGWLKAKTGGHEVINTIMLNFVAANLTFWLLKYPMLAPNRTDPISPDILDSAKLFRFFADEEMRFHIGFFIALALGALVYWFLFKTKWGFELRTVGSNPDAARYAGINPARSIIIAMSLSGALAGLAGANEVLGLNHNLAPAAATGYGFDGIAIALLGKSQPLGVVLSALLFGTLRNGGNTLKRPPTSVPIDLILIMQAFILVFVAAPAIVRTIYRLREPEEVEEGVFVRGWGGS